MTRTGASGNTGTRQISGLSENSLPKRRPVSGRKACSPMDTRETKAERVGDTDIPFPYPDDHDGCVFDLMVIQFL